MQNTGEIVVFLVLGAAIAAGLFLLARWAKKSATVFAAYALIAVAFLYVGFAFRSDNPNAWAAVEMTGVALFGSLALLSIYWSPWFVVAGFAAHPLWAIYFHYVGAGSDFTPAPIALATAGFDGAMALGTAFFLWSRRATPSSPTQSASNTQRGRAR